MSPNKLLHYIGSQNRKENNNRPRRQQPILEARRNPMQSVAVRWLVGLLQ